MLNKIRTQLHHIKNKKIIIAVVIALLLGYWFLKPKPPPPIATETVQVKNLIQSISGTGNINSASIVNLNFLLSGKLVTVNAKKGDLVRAGQVIVSQDQRNTEKNLQTALRNYSEQRNTFDQSINDNNNGSTNPDNATTDKLKRVLQDNQYDLDKAVLSVELQSLAAEQSIITAPFDGVLIRADDTIPNTNVTSATTYTIADMNHLNFQVDIDEADIGKIHVGQLMRINLDAFPDQTLSFPITRIDDASHTTSTGGTAYTVEANVDKSNNAYRLGMQGDADIIIAEKDHVLTIPLSSLTTDNFVYVQKNKKFVKQKVRTGLSNDTDIEVISGLQPNDTIAALPSDIK